MIRNVLTTMTDAHTYPIVALVLFLLVFLGSILWAASMNRNQVAAMCRMPLEDSNDPNQGESR